MAELTRETFIEIQTRLAQEAKDREEEEYRRLMRVILDSQKIWWT